MYLRGDAVPNWYLLKKHRELVKVWRLPRLLLSYFETADRCSIAVLGKTIFYVRGFEEKLIDTPTWAADPQIRFTEEEHYRGEAILARFGLERGRYVCLHARDPAYGLSYFPRLWASRGLADHVAAAKAEDIEKNLGQRSRNSDFRDYRAALEVLAARGLKGVRLGAKVNFDFSSELPNLVDFAGREREQLHEDGEFADLYLMAHCAFYVGTTTGVTGSSYAFSRPTALVNHFPWVLAFVPPICGSLHMPRLVRRQNGTLLSFGELIDIGSNWRKTYDDGYFHREGLETVDNTPEELAEAVAEMCDRFEGKWREDPGDEARQRAFKELAGPALPQDPLAARVSRAFLARHADLLVGERTPVREPA
jgi:putative glycosyltransferase (TIGR04372 family)